MVPSRYEGFGLPAVEAMACGAPVVACRAGALAEVTSLAGGGILVPKDDPDQLAAGITELLLDPARRRQLAERARPRIEATFSWSKVAEATAGVHREVVDERSGGRRRTV